MPAYEKAADGFNLISNFQVISPITDSTRLHLRWQWNSTDLAKKLFQKAKVLFYTDSDMNVSGEHTIEDPNVNSFDLLNLQIDTQYIVCLRVMRKRIDQTENQSVKTPLRLSPASFNAKNEVNSYLSPPAHTVAIESAKPKFDTSPKAYVAEMECRVALTQLAHWSAMISIFSGIIIACLIALGIAVFVRRTRLKSNVKNPEHYARIAVQSSNLNSEKIDDGLMGKNRLGKLKSAFATKVDIRSSHSGSQHTKPISTTTEETNRSPSHTLLKSGTLLDTPLNATQNVTHKEKLAPETRKHASPHHKKHSPSSSTDTTQSKKDSHKRTVSFVDSGGRKPSTTMDESTDNPSLCPTSDHPPIVSCANVVSKQDSENKTINKTVERIEDKYLSTEMEAPLSCCLDEDILKDGETKDTLAVVQPSSTDSQLGESEQSANSSLKNDNGVLEPRPVTPSEYYTSTGLNTTGFRKFSWTTEHTKLLPDNNKVPEDLHYFGSRVPIQEEIIPTNESNSNSFFYTQVVESL